MSSQGYICPQKGVVHHSCHLQGQTNVISGIHLSPKMVLYTFLATCRDRLLASQGYTCPDRAYANFWGLMLMTQAVAELAARAEQE